MNQVGNAVGGDPLSVVHLSRLHERVLQLREHLRAALLDNGPQMEMIIFHSLFDLYQHFYYEVFYTRASVSADALPISAETRFVTSSYTQDILAACVYLIETDDLPEVYVVPRRPPPPLSAHNEDNASRAYVSKAQRQFCFSIFMYMCWSSTSLSLKDVLHALYPLLDPGVSNSTVRPATTPSAAAEEGPSTHTENSIAIDLFSQPRFTGRKRWLGEILSGLVLSRANGLRAFLRVLLLDDRVEPDMTVEAAQLMVRLLTAPLSVAWMLSEPQSASTEVEAANSGTVDASLRVIRNVSPSIETQIKSLAPQLLSLLGEQAEDKEDDSAGAAAMARESSQPRFLARMGALHQRLPTETLEQRLHLFVTLFLNALVKLPPRPSSDFARCYCQFFYTNKYILSPGFGCLSLRGEGPYKEEDVVTALRRLTSLVKGVALGAGTNVLSHVLPATAAGVLNLCALQRTAAARGSAETVNGHRHLYYALQRLLAPLLSNPSLHELTAHAFVHACTAEYSHTYSEGNAVEPKFAYVHAPGSAQTLTGGFEWLLFAMPLAAPDFVHVCVEVMVDACQQNLYAAGVESLFTPNVPLSSARRSVDGAAKAETTQLVASPPLVLLLERLCLEAPSEAIFGTREQLSLVSTLTLLGRLLGLSVVLYRWAVSMLNTLLTSDSVRAALQSDGAAQRNQQLSTYDAGQALEEHRRFLSSFARTCQGILSTLHMFHGHNPRHYSVDGRSKMVAPPIIEDDADLLTLTTKACAALNSCVADAARQLNECGIVCDAPSMSEDDGGGSRNNQIVAFVAAQWQRLSAQLQSALDGRAPVDVALTLATFSRSVDDTVHDVVDPAPLQSVVQPLLLTLVRALYECEEMGCAVRAVHCMTWLCIYRFDSPDSTFISDIVWAVLGEDQLPAWLAAHIGRAAGKVPTLMTRFCRLRVRLLDVLLALTDYDEDGRTLRNIDDVLRRTRRVALYDVLVRRCHSSSDTFVQVATLHFLGAYALAVHPRVPLPALCELCRDVFRLSSHEMAKAACAAALGKVMATLCHSSNATTSLLTEVDLGMCQDLASAMVSYRGLPQSGTTVKGSNTSLTASTQNAEVDMHDAVIQQHGRDILQLLRNASQLWGTATSAEAPTVLQVKMPNSMLKWGSS